MNPRSLFLLAACVVLLGAPAPACPICLGRWGEVPTLVEDLMGSDQVAVASSKDGRQFTVWEVLRGDDAEVEPAPYVGKGEPGRAILLARAADTKIWKSLGPLDGTLRPFVEKALTVRPLKAALDEVWHRRLDRFEGELGHPDERIGSSAWAIWANAPYHILAQRESLPPLERLRAWLADDVRPREDNLWWTLLGQHGTADDEARVLATLEQQWTEKDSTALAALASALLAMQGREAVPSLEERYLLDRTRTLKEVESVVQALALHGTESDDLQPVVRDTFRRFLRTRRPLAGLVAADLAAWECWDDWELYRDLLTSGEPVLPNTRKSILDYLESSPHEAARELARSLRPPPDKPLRSERK